MVKRNLLLIVFALGLLWALSAFRLLEPAQPADAKVETVCLGSAGQGVNCLDEKGNWQTFRKKSGGLSGDYIKDLEVCPDGRIMAAHLSGIAGFDGKKWVDFPISGFNSVEAFACGAKNTLWVAYFKGISYFDGSNWTAFPASDLATGSAASDLVRDVAVTEQGVVWVITPNSIATSANQGQEWKVYQEGQGLNKKYFFDKLTVDAQGRPWVSHSNGLLVLEDGDKWKSIEHSLIGVRELLVDARGRVLAANLKGLQILDNNAWQTIDRKTGLSSNNVRSFALDTSGRMWVATEWGLNVYDGKTWKQYFMSNSELIDNDFVRVVVSGAGPALLPKPVDKGKGVVTGKLNKDKAPLADVKVELCVEKVYSSFSGKTPCDGQGFNLSSVTGADGVFNFKDVPAGYYILFTETTLGKWATLKTSYGTTDRVLVEANKTSDLQELEVSTK